ncbi:outer membrane protein OmpA-like peptidoglycan-associated protein [Azospirillum lipoferum]|uniref:OmpA family protein n=1 Tax=Azospirillum lipoferum TaxID=193 RepID=A0A5A9GRX9_AZOLI|nr:MULTISPECIES: OmpA family protein [Azospirillum]KAA0597147.1 OmpA family protein [Azospirillum lipoferum]MCP1608645.1 outer membrane protein OmpA-like peptidoglycan-associated protein [Azospirillum lipoferum]MDW5536037.1 OmpA family protein [Azospirillum sp. NL1]
MRRWGHADRKHLAAAALCAVWTLSPAALSAAAPANSAAGSPAGLTLENAVPLTVPPRPSLRTPPPVKAPPRLNLPQPLEAPPPPALTEGPAQPVPRSTTTARNQPAQNPTATPVQPQQPIAQPAPSAPVPAAPRTDTAALPPPPEAAPPAANLPPSSVLSLVFPADATNLPDAADAEVDRIVERLRASDTARLQLRSYASGTPDTAREARQRALARALALRERLTAFGIRSTRVDVRALGLDEGGGVPDRIDVVFLNE